MKYLGIIFIMLLLVGCDMQNSTPPSSTAISTYSSATPQDLNPNLRERALQIGKLPKNAACPVTPPRDTVTSYAPLLGSGPVYAAGFDQSSALLYGEYKGSEWKIANVLWVVDPMYKGEVFIRGRQVDGDNQVRFDDEIANLTDSIYIQHGDIPGANYWRERRSYTRVLSSGCYAYQVDGRNFSYLIYFTAIP